MLGLLVVVAIIGLCLVIAARRRPLRWLGAGLMVLSLVALGWIVALVRASVAPGPLPEVIRAIIFPTVA